MSRTIKFASRVRCRIADVIGNVTASTDVQVKNPAITHSLTLIRFRRKEGYVSLNVSIQGDVRPRPGFPGWSIADSKRFATAASINLPVRAVHTQKPQVGPTEVDRVLGRRSWNHSIC